LRTVLFAPPVLFVLYFGHCLLSLADAARRQDVAKT
jgi:hypothetical protein